ncbi:MAG: F-box protein [Trichocoleus desertorum ATA4-8-CV12]|jgi:hypothetical protein|nr:F-box protein [Trichocoleus desertorum ATA4-8-CV12]
MKAQKVEQVELFSQAELEILKFVPEELEAIEEERVPDLDSISFEEVAKELEAYFERGVEQARLEITGSPDVDWMILGRLDPRSLLRLRATSRYLNALVDRWVNSNRGRFSYLSLISQQRHGNIATMGVAKILTLWAQGVLRRR